MLKLLKGSSHEGITQIDSNISIEKSHLPLITTSVEKKKREKEKWKGNRNAVLSYLLKIYKDHNAADSEMKIVLSPRRKEKY